MILSHLLVMMLAEAASAPSPNTLALVGQPEMFERVEAIAYLPGCRAIRSVDFEQGVFIATVRDEICGVPPEGPFPTRFSLGRLPPGSYEVKLRDQRSGVALGESLAFTVPGSPLGADESAFLSVDFTGVWWSPSRNGDSFHILHAVADDRMILVWNTFDAGGSPHWYVLLPAYRAAYGIHHFNVYEPARSGLAFVGGARVDVNSYLGASNEIGFFGMVQGAPEPVTVQLQRFD